MMRKQWLEAFVTKLYICKLSQASPNALNLNSLSKMDQFEIIPAIIGAIIGSMLTRYLDRNKEKVNLAFELHKEFNSSEMSAHRKKAEEIIKKHLTISYDKIQDIDGEGAISLFVIMRFYQRLWLSIKHCQVKKKLVYDLFGPVFYYYYYLSYEKNLVHLDWLISNHLKDLSHWFEKNTPKKEHERLKQKYFTNYVELLALESNSG